jgi:hypothetical protein
METSTVMKTERIFVSLPADQWLTKQENNTKWAIVGEVEKLGYTAEIFLDPRGTHSLAAPLAWSAASCEHIMRRCEGCVVLGFPRWRIPGDVGQIHLPTEFNHYEGAVAHTLGLPLLVLVQHGVSRRVVFDPSYKGYVGIIPNQPTPKWLKTKTFQVPFKYWRQELELRRDIFLGYFSSSANTARKIKSFLNGKLGLSVLDWAKDFDPATSILHQIEEASKRCGGVIFLFTKDDALSGRGKRAVPRDNVVFEAGYFSALKGKSKVLIVLESGAKLPADLGGDIYAGLADRTDIDPIKPILRKFVEAL